MSSLQQTDSGATMWLVYVILALVLLVLIVWWLFQRVKEMEREALSGEPPTTTGRETREEDLTRIEGIGPKVAKVLNAAGITTFEDLSRADPEDLKNVLNEAGLQMMNPEGWIEQAHFAAKEDWDGLQKLQEELRGGRRK